MKRKAPLARPHAFAHLYDLSPDGGIAVAELNIPLLDPGPLLDEGEPHPAERPHG
jgi:hypothetical protein